MNKRVIIIGAARQGTALARFLAEAGAHVVLTDMRISDELSDAKNSLKDLSIKWVLGKHPLDLLDDADLVCPSGGVPLTIPIIEEALIRGIPLSNDSQIFINETEATVIGITGSAGKTTTTSLLGRIAEKACLRSSKWNKSYVGGNIGNPLIADIHEINKDDVVVMELSSFQLEIMTAPIQIAVILNITPNHLDRHKTMEAYTNAKLNILKHQDANGIAVLMRDEVEKFNIQNKVSPNLFSFGYSELEVDQQGSFIRNNEIWLRDPTGEYPVIAVEDIELKGEHNVLNVLAACAISSAAGFPVEAMQAGIKGFTAVEHRMEFVRTWHGADWYNDSIATAPERTIAAIRSFNEPLLLLLGGRDKDLPWQDLAKITSERDCKVIVFGEAVPIILDHLSKYPHSRNILSAKGLDEAVQLAAGNVEAGEIVLLSPGGTSFDEFIDFAERGNRYKELVQKL